MSAILHQELSDIFADTEKHREVRRIVQAHGTNKQDIRLLALEGLQTETALSILDMGSGFGFFTQALKGVLPAGATVLGIDRFASYGPYFLDTCKSIGIAGRFEDKGTEVLKSLPNRTFDLILCSYALYFFPEAIPELARLLKTGGNAVIIIHSVNHALECMSMVRESYRQSGLPVPELLPYEDLIGRINDSNGADQLACCFGRVHQKDYESALVFTRDDFDDLVNYFLFKKPYYIQAGCNEDSMVTGKLLALIKERLDEGQSFRITKNDTIFICSNPLSTA